MLFDERGSIDGAPIGHVTVEGPLGRVDVEIKALSVADPSRVARIIEAGRARRRGTARVRLHMLVADEISEASRSLLRDSGWGYLDRRGRLWFTAPGVHIDDTELASVPRRGVTLGPLVPISGRVGLSAALRLLMQPDQPVGVRELARAVPCAPSAAHAALARLRAASLIGADGRPLLPELFWATAEAWHPNRAPVAREPDSNEFQLGMHAGDSQGWAATGDAAAAAWGAPLVMSSASPVDFYVPTQQEARIAVRQLGESSWLDRAATIAPAPVASVTNQRDLRRASVSTRRFHWPLAHPVVVALDLAQDRSRGREILEGWEAPDGYRRVW